MPQFKFRKGDVVRCISHHYALPYGNIKVVREVQISSGGNEVIQLDNIRSPYGTSDYLSDNFELVSRKRRTENMAYEKTKFFAMKMNPGQLPGNATDLGLRLHAVSVGSLSDMHSFIMTTPLRDHRTAVQADVKARIAEGDRWLVVQTVCLIEGEEPRPPIRVTEYK